MFLGNVTIVSANIFMKKILTVKLDEKTIQVAKLPLGKYAELLAAIKELPKHISTLDGKSNEEILQNLPMIISQAFPDIVGILVIATQLTKDEIEALGLDEVTRVLVAVIEVNNYREVYENIKKVMGRPVQPEKPAIG